MAKEKRTFGWVQNPASTNSLKRVVSLFVSSSQFYSELKDVRLPLLKKAGLLADITLYDTFMEALSKDTIQYPLLKGKGSGGQGRANALCSGIAQAALDAQKTVGYYIDGKTVSMKKPYVDDWSADGFLRWAVSIGFLDYNEISDSCCVTELGKSFALSNSSEEDKILLGTAYLSYPPVSRILSILSDGGHYTKFEIGQQLGFSDEPGFTSFPQNIWVRSFCDALDVLAKKDLRSNSEGSADKYARMICGWLEKIGWVKCSPKQVTEFVGGHYYTATISSAFTITAEGIINFKRAIGKSRAALVPKIVYREMLASKAPNAEKLRIRRAMILKYIGGTAKRSISDIVSYLNNSSIVATEIVVRDDLCGLQRIGLNISEENGLFHLRDKILKLSLNFDFATVSSQSEQEQIKERVRERLFNLDHKYLSLIDHSFQGKDSKDFEIATINLFTNELGFVGMHLGGSRRPDGIIFWQDNGVIIDNKAYSKGFNITRHMADEMIRYLQENGERKAERNQNKWWEAFGPLVCQFFFMFISSRFRGHIKESLLNIMHSSGVSGVALNTENLLYFAEDIKAGKIEKSDFLQMLGANNELIHSSQ